MFIYITHDTTFAANHPLADKIWIKNYDEHDWEFEKIKNSDIPEELLLNIMGNRKNVLFVEGVYNSLDYRLYNVIYKDVYIVCKNNFYGIYRNEDGSYVDIITIYQIK